MLRDMLNEETISESQKLAILKDLHNMTMTAPLLNATQIGKVLTRLKNTDDGIVGEIARRMKADWNWIILDHEKQEAISGAVDKVVKEVQHRLGQAVGHGQPLPVPNQPTFETSTTSTSKQSLEERRYLLTKFEFAMLDNQGVQKRSFEKLFEEKKYFEVDDTLYRSWLHLKLDALGTEREAFDAVLKQRMIKNVPKRKKKRAMNEPEGIDRHMPQSDAFKEKLKEIEEKKKVKDNSKKKKKSNDFDGTEQNNKEINKDRSKNNRISKNNDNNNSNDNKNNSTKKRENNKNINNSINSNTKKKDNNKIINNSNDNKNKDNNKNINNRNDNNNKDNNNKNINNSNENKNKDNNNKDNNNKNSNRTDYSQGNKEATQSNNVGPVDVDAVSVISDITGGKSKRKIAQVSGINEGKTENDNEPKIKRLRKKTVPFTSK